MSEREPFGFACESCGKDLSEHLGLVGTCRQLTMYRQLHEHAIEQVDIVFQDEGKRKALLSDFLHLGEDKFEGVVKLAVAYLQSQSQLTAVQQRVAELEQQRDKAIAMLADWCIHVDINGTNWDDWDEAYKDAMYRPCEIRELLDAAIAKERLRWKEEYGRE